MTLNFSFSFFFTVFLIFCSCNENSPKDTPVTPTNTVFNITGNKEYSLNKDDSTLLRNPCSGWGLYDDASGEVSDATQYWALQDASARNYGSFFYVRWRWSDMEPEEGKYAWIYNENYKKLIQGALDRGLKLAFRIYNNGQDNLRQGTPDFVKLAGAKGYQTTGSNPHWTPYIDDAVFQTKLENFIKAFAKEYDNPDKVDFVDGVNVGWWGECDHLELQNNTQQGRDSFLTWITSVYGNNFKKVILVMNMDSGFGYSSEFNIAINRQGYGYRRDGLGSSWFTENNQKHANSSFPKTVLIGESCYWGGNQAWSSDTKYNLKSWRQVYELTTQQALQYHFNTLDLRGVYETKGWTTTALDLVQKFIQLGGYRLYPSIVSAPETIAPNGKITIGHQWVNLAQGVCPNNNPRWNYKYKVAFALIDSQGKIAQLFIDKQSDPSTFISDNVVKYTFDATLSNLALGNYTLGVAIVDTTKNNLPGIRLATTATEIAGWKTVGSVIIK